MVKIFYSKSTRKHFKNRRIVTTHEDIGIVEIAFLDKKNNLHRVGAPAFIVFNNKTRKILREEWLIHGINHRVGGPAVTWKDGEELWYNKGLLHRLDGPAATNEKYNRLEYWINGNKYTKEQWFDKLTYDERISYLFKMNK